MKPCRWAGKPCENEATTVIRIAGVGDRPVCDSHIAIADNLGLPYRRLDPEAPAQEWRRRLPAVDMTGGIR